MSAGRRRASGCVVVFMTTPIFVAARRESLRPLTIPHASRHRDRGPGPSVPLPAGPRTVVPAHSERPVPAP
jgi:hypothetical protein